MTKKRTFLTGRLLKQCDELAPHEPHYWEDSSLSDPKAEHYFVTKFYCNGS